MQSYSHILGLKCVSCDKEYPFLPFRYRCTCGENLDVICDYPRIQRKFTKDHLRHNPDPSLWRYLPLLPVKNAPVNHSIRVGGTPLTHLPRQTLKFHSGDVWIKNDTVNPSGSLKDRASEVGIQHATELEHDVMVAASTGNAAASLSALSAFYGKQAIILAPADAPAAKLTQIIQYDATLVPVDGNYDDAFDMSSQLTERHGWYSRNTGMNPVMAEGKKTVAFEIAEQLNWNVPDAIFVPVGDGCIISGVFKGFFDLVQLGWIETLPRLIAVQAEGSNAIVKALDSKKPVDRISARTVADSICVDLPRDGLKAMQAVTRSGGFGMTVSDEEILAAQHDLARISGIFAEPAGATSWAGFVKARQNGLITEDSSVLIMATGSGLKDIPAAQKMITIPERMPADPDKISAYLRDKL